MFKLNYFFPFIKVSVQHLGQQYCAVLTASKREPAEKNIKIGNKVLVQMGVIIKVVSEAENKSILEAWESLA